MRSSALSFLCVLFSATALSSAASAQPAFTTCIGDIGNCSTSTTSINMGPATVGGGSFVPVKISNPGTAPLSISYSFSAPAFAFGLSQTLPPNPLIVQPGQSVQTFIVFLPVATGTQSAQFTSNDNAPGSPHVIPLSGTGVAVAAADFAVMLDPAGPSTITLRQGTTTTFPVYLLEGVAPNLSAGGAAQCAGGPPGSSCSVQPSAFPAFVSQVKIIVSVSVPARMGLLVEPSLVEPSLKWPAVAVLPTLIFLCGRRRPGRFVVALTVLVAASLVSCGGGSSTSSPPITITAGVNGASKMLTVPVTVQ